MSGKTDCCGGDTSDVFFDEKAFGAKKPSKELIDNMRATGWLSQDGICHFPFDVVAYPSGWKAKLPPEFFDRATDDDIENAIDKGWITFGDGNGDYHTLSEYNDLYPDYPDPEFIMRLEGRFPPVPGSIIRLGGKYDKPETVRLGGPGARSATRPAVNLRIK